MNQSLHNLILEVTHSDAITDVSTIQTLWSGYGEILKARLSGGNAQSVIVKHIQLPEKSTHPRGWNTEFSHLRKIKSYHVELNWYENWNQQCDDHCKTAETYKVLSDSHEQIIIMQDLDAVGYSQRKSHLNPQRAKTCLDWLAHFHACFMNVEPIGLWQTGTYWHLATRPDELQALQNDALKKAAPEIDRVLNDCSFQTLVHGDAKVANFCFSKTCSQNSLEVV